MLLNLRGVPWVNPFGSGNFKASRIYTCQPLCRSLDPLNGTGLVSWQDNRIISVPNGDNVLMQHLDSLNVADYTPLNKKVQSLSNGNTYANATVITGSSKKFGTWTL